MSTKRTHSKSRLGCKQCKSRRIKCDETPPQCENCIKRGLECDYQGWESAFRNIRFFTPPILPQKSSRSASNELAESSTPPITPQQTFTLDDMGLLCHYILHTSQTMDFGGEATIEVWQRDVPQIAKLHPFLMHAVLAFAAVHQAQTEESQAPHSLQLAHHHYGQALQLFRQSVNQVAREQAEVLLCFGILTNFLTATLQLVKSADHQDSIDGFTRFFDMLHNFEGMLAPVRSSLRVTVIATQLRHAHDTSVPHDIPADAAQSLNRLRDLAQRKYLDCSTSTDDARLIDQTLAKLSEFYMFVDPHPQTWNRILRWPEDIDAEFSALLQSRNPIALCIIAHWCVAFHNAPRRWYFGERPRQLMLAIARELHESEWAEGISWPLHETVGEIQY